MNVRFPIDQAVKNALKEGVLIRPLSCEWCGGPPPGRKGMHGHHEAYDRPLDVIWLCAKCHSLRHGRLAHLTAEQFMAIAPAKIGSTPIAPSREKRTVQTPISCTILDVVRFCMECGDDGMTISAMREQFGFGHRTAQRMLRRMERGFPGVRHWIGEGGFHRWAISSAPDLARVSLRTPIKPKAKEGVGA